MINHIAFCLDEINAELGAQEAAGLSASEIAEIAEHVGAVRHVLMRHILRGIAAPAAIVPATVEAPAADDLGLIRGIDGTAAARLAAHGVTSFASIAGWNSSELATFAAGDVTLRDDICRDNWIEQAAVLATGALTVHAARIRLGRPVAVAMMPVAPTLSPSATILPFVAVETSSAETEREIDPQPFAATADTDAAPTPEMPLAQSMLAVSHPEQPQAAARSPVIAENATSTIAADNVIPLTRGTRSLTVRARMKLAASLLFVASIGLVCFGKFSALAAAARSLGTY